MFKMLHGHTNFENAFVIESYPYGRLRCKKKMWVETAVKGSAKGEQRVVSCTTNPKASAEVWNKPHAGCYYGMACLYINPENEHVEVFALPATMTHRDLARFKKSGLFWQMDDDQKRQYELCNKCGHRYNATSWYLFDELYSAIRLKMASSPSMTKETMAAEMQAVGLYQFDEDFNSTWDCVQADLLHS